MPRSYDIAVLGGTAAGYVAALTLARKGHKVAVLAGGGSGSESPLADWIPADALTLCPALRSVRSSGTDGAFREVRFHSEQLDRQARYRCRGTAGYVLRSGAFLSALARAARKAKVEVASLADSPDVELGESAVAVRGRSAGRGAGRPREFRAALLLIAQGRPAEVVAKLALPVRSVPTGRIAICGLDAPRGRARMDNALHVVAWASGRERLGMFFAARGLIHVRIIAIAEPPPAEQAGRRGSMLPGGLGEALSQLIGRLQGGGLLPAKLDLTRAAGAIWRPPGAVALELETHLAKRTLLVGTAGGFASAVTGQTLDASIRSALVAADVADRALRGKAVQDSLAGYKRQWQSKLAERIRPPGTSLKMLLPIVFSNQAMANRFARALLYGERI